MEPELKENESATRPTCVIDISLMSPDLGSLLLLQSEGGIILIGVFIEGTTLTC